jgi:hypothetical protein
VRRRGDALPGGERGLNALEMTLAHLHAAAAASVLTGVFVLVAVSRDVKQFPRPFVRVSLAASFVAFLLLNVWRAARRPPRTRLGATEMTRLTASGCVVGLVGLALAAAAAAD